MRMHIITYDQEKGEREKGKRKSTSLMPLKEKYKGYEMDILSVKELQNPSVREQ